ncbi:MAG TPA: glycosyltransferase family 39 protein, partial [Planctomycetaceae bacterium]|nr:glycosyltransferase family 39 protein [Planctomycetaceae bacterium]
LFIYAPLTALGLYAAGRRWFSRGAGLLAALIYISTPWIDRLTTIAYVESGLLFYLFASLLAVLIAIERLKTGDLNRRLALLTGLLAGSGMACKYTGALQVVAPIGAAIVLAPGFTPSVVRSRIRAAVTLGLFFALGVAATIGPWLLKNVVETHNPVFPLAYSLFGASQWSDGLNAKFVSGHTTHSPRSLFQCLGDVTANNDWSSPLWYALAPLALFARPRRIMIFGLWAFAGFLFITWFAFTHQIDRFWIPMIPVMCLLAGIGAEWRSDATWRWGRNVVVALALLFNFALIAGNDTAYLLGYNAFLSDLDKARENREQPYVRYLNELNAQTPVGIKVLCVGDAEVFEARFPVVYNAVFNESIFEQWFALKPGSDPATWTLKPKPEVADRLHKEGITHVYVNWSWIRTYRSPGNYDYSKFVTADRFEQLVAAGVLGQPTSWGAISLHGMSDAAGINLLSRMPFLQRTSDGRIIQVTDAFDVLTDQELKTLKEVGPSLLVKSADPDARELLINAQIFPVR